MALIVEDGSIVAGADSYISLADARTLAANWGIALPIDDTEAEIALRKGTAYIGLNEGQFSGSRVSNTQSLSWPRNDAYRYGVLLANDSIHPDIQLAQVQAAGVYGDGVEVRPVSDGSVITSEEIASTIKLGYENKSGSNSVAITPSDDLLEPFFDDDSNLTSFDVGRA